MKKYLVLLVLISMLGGAFYYFTSPPLPDPEPVPVSSQSGTRPLTTQTIIPQINRPLLSGDTRFLELINDDYPVNGEPSNETIIDVWPGVAVSTTAITLHEAAREAVLYMFDAADAQNIGPYYVTSGYRDEEEQRETFNEMADKSLVQPPGYSEHQAGLAMDIMAEGVKQFELADSPEGKWLADNSWRYGLLLRYTDDKSEFTGVAGEAWHFRYVGQPHAWFCYQNNLCLEEYIEHLRETGGYEAQLDGISYTVKYGRLGDGTAPEPDDGMQDDGTQYEQYEISSDNTGGYVLTSWE
jgi:D-alanyl-D-alanine carboxypeptidase